MKKIIYLLMLTALFASCSDDDNYSTSTNGKANLKIDERIIGRWKVVHSKTIIPCKYDWQTGKINYPEGANISEYDGASIHVSSGMFNTNEYNIDIRTNNTIETFGGPRGPITKYYQIVKDSLVSCDNLSDILYPNSFNSYRKFHKYKYDRDTLVIEFTGAYENGVFKQRGYIISKYIRMK